MTGSGHFFIKGDNIEDVAKKFREFLNGLECKVTSYTFGINCNDTDAKEQFKKDA